MEQDCAIEVSHVYKEFNSHIRNNSFKNMIVYRERKNRSLVRKVLNDVSFSVKKGEVLGIIGRNGSGKSTTLKLLSKILWPDAGTINIKGKVACLIELGAGFHPDMTGRENVYINASIFGIPQKTVNQRIQQIIDFSEIGDYIDERVRNYSSGMYLRLAFSVAINVDADVLLIDEILAVGDLQFQKKCINKLKEFRDNGGTIVLVTHDVGQVKEMCDRAMWIDGGEIRMIGDVDTVCDEYCRVMLN